MKVDNIKSVNVEDTVYESFWSNDKVNESPERSQYSYILKWILILEFH